jgi:hypothetical protein
MSNPIREQYGWVVVTPSRTFLLWSVRPPRSDAIHAALTTYGEPYTWRQLRARGFCAIRVVIRPWGATQ